MGFNSSSDELNKFGVHYLTDKISSDKRRSSIAFLNDIIDKYGSVIEGYPCWHPFVQNANSFYPQSWPDQSSGYQYLDHTILFRDAFITCPYRNVDLIIESIDNLPKIDCAKIEIKFPKVSLYHELATPVLVTCKWQNHPHFRKIPMDLAISMFLEKELFRRHQSLYLESWNEVAPFYLGEPHHNLSSIFVDSETGSILKKLWGILVKSEGNKHKSV